MSLWMHLIPGYTVTKALTATVGLLSDSSSKPLSELEEIGRRVEIESAALLSQAKVEQEVSIARRILCAQEVEIEEFYDVKGSGSLPAFPSKSKVFSLVWLGMFNGLPEGLFDSMGSMNDL